MTLKNHKILITGGAGFIGSTLAEHLYEQNEIVIFDIMLRDSLKTKSFIKHPHLTTIVGDVLDLAAVERAMAGCSIVYHAAGIAGINATIEDPVNTMRVNMMGTANVLSATAKMKGIKRFIDFSTSEVFGSQALNVSESDDTVLGPVGEARWTYAVSKLAGEHLGLAYYHRYKVPVVSVRPFNVYGPGQVGEGAMQIFIRRALNNEDIFIFGEGSQIRAWCYIDDFVTALLKCAESPEAVGEVINIGNPRAVITILGLAHLICRVLNSKSKIIFRPALSADIELRIPKVDKMLKILGLSAQIELEEGIVKFADWITKYESDLPNLSPIFTGGKVA